MRISFIGSGNVATHLGAAFKNAGHRIGEIWSPDAQHAALLAYHLGATTAESPELCGSDADLLIISVKDDAIPEVAGKIRSPALVAHTSGSTPLDVIAGCSDRTGVIYPLQTFSKYREIDFRQVPVCIEGNTAATENELIVLASDISGMVSQAGSEKRVALHVAAVFASNFCNHFYHLAESIALKNGFDFDLLRPLILETAAKVSSSSPGAAQTGPAVREDRAIIQKHLDFLQKEPELSGLYRELSQQIINFKKRP